MHLLIAIACFLGGAVVGGAAALALAVAVLFAAVPPSGGPEYKDIPKSLAVLGLPALGAVVVAGALAAVRAQVPWPFHSAILGAAIFGVAVFAVAWGYAMMIGVAFQDAPD